VTAREVLELLKNLPEEALDKVLSVCRFDGEVVSVVKDVVWEPSEAPDEVMILTNAD
jgi:hypothetical protein